MPSLEILLQYFIGIFYCYHGLNGFFHFQKLPQVSERMEKFLKNIEETQFILPTVKMIEIISGVMLIANQAPFLAAILLLPIVFGITASQILFNFKKGKGITVVVVIPFLVYLYLHSGDFVRY